MNDLEAKSNQKRIHKIRQIKLAIQLVQKKWHPIKGETGGLCLW